jgi:hypothetical protein
MEAGRCLEVLFRLCLKPEIAGRLQASSMATTDLVIYLFLMRQSSLISPTGLRLNRNSDGWRMLRFVARQPAFATDEVRAALDRGTVRAPPPTKRRAALSSEPRAGAILLGALSIQR